MLANFYKISFFTKRNQHAVPPGNGWAVRDSGSVKASVPHVKVKLMFVFYATPFHTDL